MIDRVFDLVDRTIDNVDHVLNRAKYTEDQHRARHAKRPVVIDTACAVKVVKAETPPQPSTSTALAIRRFRLIEAVDASGQTIFVVTNGATARAECATRELAEKLLRALEAST